MPTATEERERERETEGESEIAREIEDHRERVLARESGRERERRGDEGVVTKREEEKAGAMNVTMTSATTPPLLRRQVVDSSVGADYVSRLHKGQAACLQRVQKLADGKGVNGGRGKLDISPVPFFDMEVAGVYPLRY